jgi:1-deoxy-D-xylulose-5-phosphate reductoisomerase
VSRRRIAVLGSTGSVGTQALDVVRTHRDDYEVIALAAGRNTELLAAQAAEFGVPAERARSGLDDVGALAELAALPDADVVLNAVVGFAGLPATIAALESGKRLALANKESLIAAAPVVQPLRDVPGAELIPVDSEHCAIHQCLRAGTGHHGELSRLVLTASGGPFRGRTATDLANVTIDDALAHPTWKMGPKITVDSSTLMNKGLEVIEAHELFGVPYDQIEVVVHPQSVIHSMVEFSDGATIAQLSMPDMRLPIGYALAYPDRIGTAFGRIDWSALRRLDFEAPDLGTFRCLGLAYEAGRVGGTAPAWLNAANEVAVAAFLAGQIGWSTIPDVLDAVLSGHDGAMADDVEAVIAADGRARLAAGAVIERARSRT